MSENQSNPGGAQGNNQKQEKFVFDPVTMATNSKVDDKFSKSFANILAIAGIGGRKALKKKKVPNANVSKLVDEVYQEQSEAAEQEFKNGFKELMVDYQTFEAETKKAYEAFVGEVAKRKQTFAERADALVGKLQNIDELRNSFARSTSTLVKNTEGADNAGSENESTQS